MWIKLIDEKQHYVCREMECCYGYYPFPLFILICFLANPKVDSIGKYLSDPIVKTNAAKFKIFDLVK